MLLCSPGPDPLQNSSVSTAESDPEETAILGQYLGDAGMFSIHLTEVPFKHKLVLSDARRYPAVLDPAELPLSPTSPSTAPQEKMAQTEQLIFENVVKET